MLFQKALKPGIIGVYKKMAEHPPSLPSLFIVNKLNQWSRCTRKLELAIVLQATRLKKIPTNKLPIIALSHFVIA